MHIMPQKGDTDVVLPEGLINGKPQVAYDVLHFKGAIRSDTSGFSPAHSGSTLSTLCRAIGHPHIRMEAGEFIHAAPVDHKPLDEFRIGSDHGNVVALEDARCTQSD